MRIDCSPVMNLVSLPVLAGERIARGLCRLETGERSLTSLPGRERK